MAPENPSCGSSRSLLSPSPALSDLPVSAVRPACGQRPVSAARPALQCALPVCLSGRLRRRPRSCSIAVQRRRHGYEGGCEGNLNLPVAPYGSCGHWGGNHWRVTLKHFLDLIYICSTFIFTVTCRSMTVIWTWLLCGWRMSTCCTTCWRSTPLRR